MVHVRPIIASADKNSGGENRVGETPLIFGNAGALYKQAMTWWDHQTMSVWSQPIGEALEGPLVGTELTLFPVQIVSWERWQASYPHTFVMINDLDRVFTGQSFRDGFVIGIVLGTPSSQDTAKAFNFRTVVHEGVLNDTVGDSPVVLWAQEQDYRAYFRQVDHQVLTFAIDGETGQLVDAETESRWDPLIGLAVEGPLTGETLQAAPSFTSFDWAWWDFYPDTEIVGRVR